MFEFSMSNLLAGFFFSVWAVFFLKEAKKSSNIYLAFVGLALFVDIYMVSDDYLVWIFGALLMLLGFKFR